jgi:hypothetical protein
MSGRVLANAGVFALGMLLIGGGGWAVWHGSGYIQLEWGWSSVIAGSIAATGGVLTLGVGFVLQRLDALHRVLLRAGTGAGVIAQPAQAFVAEEPAKETMPNDIETVTPIAHTPEPQSAPYPDPALQAAAAINLELLAHEERSGAIAQAEAPAAAGHREITETVASEPPPEVIHAAEQGPADDMIKAAGVSDEPELDAAIEELLAEERGGSGQAAPVIDLPSAEPALDLPESATAPQRDEPEKTPQLAAGWRGLFSRKDRRAATALPVEQLDIQPGSDRQEQSAAEPEHTAHAEEVPVPTPAGHEAIPGTGDDWFDRALSGLDEVPELHQTSRRSTANGTSDEERTIRSNAEAQPAVPEEEASTSAAPAEPAVIGRYTSGNTTYVMFADGSIEAETPNGILHFASLADLKVYVEGQ